MYDERAETLLKTLKGKYDLERVRMNDIDYKMGNPKNKMAMYSIARRGERLSKLYNQDIDIEFIATNYIRVYLYKVGRVERSKGVYMITLGNFIYIGRTIQGMRKRFKQHMSKYSTVVRFMRNHNVNSAILQKLDDNPDNEAYWIEYYYNKGYKLINVECTENMFNYEWYTKKPSKIKLEYYNKNSKGKSKYLLDAPFLLKSMTERLAS